MANPFTGFWRDFDSKTSKEIEEKLNEPNTDIDKFLQIDDVSSELKEHSKFAKYFSPAIIFKLITYITEMPLDTDTDLVKYRYPFVSAELLKNDCKDISSIILASNPNAEYEKCKTIKEDSDVITEDIEPNTESPKKEDAKKEATPPVVEIPQANVEEFSLLKKLMDFLNKDKLNVTLAGYWGSVVFNLCNRYLDKMVLFLNKYTIYIEKAMSHLECISIADFIQKLLNDEGSSLHDNALKDSLKEIKAKIFNILLGMLSNNDRDKIANCQSIIASCIEAKGHLLEQITNEPSIDIIMHILCSPLNSEPATLFSFKACLNILRQILEAKYKMQEGIVMMDPKPVDININVMAIFKKIDNIKTILSVLSQTDRLNKQVIIKISEFVNSLLLGNIEEIYKLITEMKTFKSLMQYAAEYPNCSILMCTVFEGISYIAKSTLPIATQLISSIFMDKEIIDLITKLNKTHCGIYMYQNDIIRLVEENVILKCKEIEEKWNEIKKEREDSFNEYSEQKKKSKLELGKGIYRELKQAESPSKSSSSDSPMDDLESPENSKPKQKANRYDEEIKEEANSSIVPVKMQQKAENNKIYAAPVEYEYHESLPNLKFDENSRLMSNYAFR